VFCKTEESHFLDGHLCFVLYRRDPFFLQQQIRNSVKMAKNRLDNRPAILMIQRKLLIMNGLYSMVLLGGDLKPILGLWFQLLSMALPRELAVGVENNGI
jgi:hypothetical protein